MFSNEKRIATFMNLTLKEIPGKITASIYFLGCNMSCNYCYNLSKLEQYQQEALTVDQLKLELLKLIKKGQNNKVVKLVDCIVFSGGECTLHTKELNRLLEFSKSLGFENCVYTNGLLWNKDIKWDLVDTVSVDFKTLGDAFLPIKPRQNPLLLKSGNTSHTYISSVLATFKCLEESKIPFYIRTVLVKPFIQLKDIPIILKYLKEYKKLQGWFLTDCLFGETYDPTLNTKDNSWTTEEKKELKEFFAKENLNFPVEVIEE